MLRRRSTIRWVLLAAALPLLTLGGTTARAQGGYDWSTWGFDNARSGNNPLETTLGSGTVAGLTQKWMYPLGGPTIAQALYAADVDVGGTPHDIVYIGSESGRFSAIDAATGTPIWERTFGTRTTTCSDLPGGVFGVTSTAAFDRASNRVYVVPVDGKLYALNMSTGATVTGWPITLTSITTEEYVWSGITVRPSIDTIYVPMASYCDKGTKFHGRVIRISISQHKVLNRWWSNGSAGPTGGDIWAYGGIAVEPQSTGRLFLVADESHPDPQNQVNSEHVVRLTSDLSLQASRYWNPPGTNLDEGYGTTPMLYSTTCGNRFTVLNKAGYLVVWGKSFTSSQGPSQYIKLATGSTIFKNRLIGQTTWDPATRTIFVANWNNGAGKVRGLIALRPNQSKSGCPLEIVWQAADPSGIGFGPEGMPMVANGVVYYTTGPGKQILAYKVSDGTLLWGSPALNSDVYTAPTIANGMVFASTISWGTPSGGQIYAFGLP